MALCKDLSKVGRSDSSAFDVIVRTGTEIRYEGIYRCIGCSVEVAALGGRLFPSPQRHPGMGPCREQRWQLLVAATPYDPAPTA
jgi:hypothetical protein